MKAQLSQRKLSTGEMLIINNDVPVVHSFKGKLWDGNIAEIVTVKQEDNWEDDADFVKKISLDMVKLCYQLIAGLEQNTRYPC